MKDHLVFYGNMQKISLSGYLYIYEWYWCSAQETMRFRGVNGMFSLDFGRDTKCWAFR